MKDSGTIIKSKKNEQKKRRKLNDILMFANVLPRFLDSL